MPQTILIVDDSAMIRRIVGQILKGFGYSILQAENGEIAFEITKDQKPDLVVMDIEMPVMNGIDSTKKIKTDPSTSHIPVLMFTSLGSEEDIRQSNEAGCSGFLNKPICEGELKEAIENILG